MKLTLILVCLWLDYYFDQGAKWRNQQWFDGYVHWMKSKLGDKKGLWGGPVSILVVLLPLFVILALVWGIAGAFSGVVELIIGFVILWFCFGPTTLQEALSNYLKKDANEVETEAALKSAAGTLISPDKPFGRNVSELIFWQAHERFFGVIFWFVLLGPAGAVLYRMISWMQGSAARLQADFYPQYSHHVHQLYWIIAWIPSRLAALSYTLTGNFLPGFDKWKNDMVKPERCREVLVESGMAALGTSGQGDREENMKAKGLVQRGLLVWVLVIALATLGHIFL